VNNANSQRQSWMSTLARTPASELQHILDQLPEQPTYNLPRPVETGLCMVRGRISADGAPFNLGEMTLTRCVVQFEEHNATTGVAYVMGRDKKQAELAAVIDALLVSERLTPEALEPLREVINENRQSRAEQVASTKVDFFTLVRGED